MTSHSQTFLKSRSAIAAVCLIAAASIGIVIVLAITILSNFSTTTVVRAKADIAQGTQITKDMIYTEKVGKKGLPAGTKHKISDVSGQYALTVISKDDDLSNAKISKTDYTYDLSDGQMLFSVSVKNLAGSVSGKIAPGDIVSVFAPKTGNNGTTGTATANNAANLNQSQMSSYNPDVLQYVRVVGVSLSSGDAADKSSSSKSSSTKSSSSIPATVTLRVNRLQASVLTGYDTNTIHLALVCKGNEKKAESLLTKEDQIISNAQSAQILSGSTNSSNSSSTNSNANTQTTTAGSSTYKTTGTNSSTVASSSASAFAGTNTNQAVNGSTSSTSQSTANSNNQ